MKLVILKEKGKLECRLFYVFIYSRLKIMKTLHTFSEQLEALGSNPVHEREKLKTGVLKKTRNPRWCARARRVWLCGSRRVVWLCVACVAALFAVWAAVWTALLLFVQALWLCAACVAVLSAWLSAVLTAVLVIVQTLLLCAACAAVLSVC